MLMSPSEGETVVHCCHCPGDMAVRMREVLARPWVGVHSGTNHKIVYHLHPSRYFRELVVNGKQPLRSAVLSCVPLCSRVTLCYPVLPCFTLCSPVFPCITPCYPVLPCATLCYPVLLCVTLCSPVFSLFPPWVHCVPLCSLCPLGSPVSAL